MPRFLFIFSLLMGLSIGLLHSASAFAVHDGLAVIVPAGESDAVDKSSLILIYQRKKLFWRNGRKIYPVNLPARSLLRREFSQAVLGASPEDLENYWNVAYFNGISPPYVLQSDDAVIHFVANTPGAIGYIPVCHANAQVKVVLVITANGELSDAPGSVLCP